LILVTGGSGYIGAEVCKTLMQSGIEYSVLSKSDRPNQINFDLITGSEAELADIVNAHSKVLHCAWDVDRKTYLDSARNFDWLAATLKLAAVIDRRKITHFQGLGTCLEYKSSSAPKLITSALGAVSNYALAKILTFKGLSSIMGEKSINFAWSRLFYLYGGNEHKDKLIPTVANALKTGSKYKIRNANQIIDLSRVEHVAQMITQLSNSETSGVFNVCSGKPATIKETIYQNFDVTRVDQLIEFEDSLRDLNNLSGFSHIEV